MSKYKEVIKDKKLASGLYALTLITALLILVVVVKGPEQSGKLIVDEEGKIVGIHRSILSSSEHYDLSVDIKDDEGEIQRDVSLTLQAQNNENSLGVISKEDERAASIEAGLDRVINEIEYSKKRKIMLPSRLPDGTPIEWKSREKNTGSGMLFILLIYVALAGAMIASSLKEADEGKTRRQSILRGLPRFCNQLFLMMNAGLILSDAFDTITGSYSTFKRDDLSDFEKDLSDLRDATDHHRISTAEVINEYAVRNDVKEMIRIASILTENEKRGSDVIDSLARESRYLWDERKVVARECGKMIDTRMSYPLGLLLIVLIVITMAPALLNM